MQALTIVGSTNVTGGEIARLDLPAMEMPASGRRWRLRPVNPSAAAAIEAEAGCPAVVARILAGRGVKPAEAKRYLRPSLKEFLPDPMTLVEMDRAAARIAKAVMSGEKCGVFGDYDVDGTCGAAILKGYFNTLGAPLDVYLPDRILEGYGPSAEAFRTLKERGARVVMTVDCGAAAHQAIASAAEEGLEIVILDHHQMDGPPPQGAYATVNPNRLDDQSHLQSLSAAGVVFMAIVAINRALRDAGFFTGKRPPDLLKFLDLVALGLVCDVMPMTGLSRVLTAQGLKVLNNGGNRGLKELGARAGVGASAGVYDLGFLLGPRINAAGRIGHAQLAFDLLTTEDPIKRAQLADRLHVMNAERQAIESDVLAQAIEQVERNRGRLPAVIVAAGEGWHPGVVGIVAGRIKDRYDRPAVIIGVDGETGKGSARSLDGVDIGAAIRAARDKGLLIAGGGHAMAAGLTVAASAIGEFAAFLAEGCAADVERALSVRMREIDAVIAPTAVTGDFAALIAEAGPFGPGNPEPVFALSSMRVERVKAVGAAHLACDLTSDTGETVRAIAFRAAGEPLGALLTAKTRLHLAGRIKADTWRSAGAGQFQIIDAAKAAF
ncbi:MAG: single-stranded-DNA-specific exonuclease RecJ [Pseudomonadota bacterium]